MLEANLNTAYALCRAAVPFIILMLASLIIVIWQPWIAMYFVTGKF